MNIGELAAYVCSHLKQHGVDVVLSGGACVAVHTDHRYISYDLDFIDNLGSSRRKLRQLLGELGFREQGRYFRHPDTEFILEFPAGPLAVGEEPPGQIVVLHYATGELATLSATDCVKDRLAAYFHWNDNECLQQALLVAGTGEVDLREIERWSIREGHPEKFLAFKQLLEQQVAP